jgi:hypothetical protein
MEFYPWASESEFNISIDHCNIWNTTGSTKFNKKNFISISISAATRFLMKTFSTSQDWTSSNSDHKMAYANLRLARIRDLLWVRDWPTTYIIRRLSSVILFSSANSSKEKKQREHVWLRFRQKKKRQILPTPKKNSERVKLQWANLQMKWAITHLPPLGYDIVIHNGKKLRQVYIIYI